MRQAHGLEHGRPVDRVRGQDVLADQVVGRRPPAARSVSSSAQVADRADVVDQRVEPDVGHEVGVERQLDAPGQPALRPRDAQVVQLLPQEAQRLVAPEVGLDERGVARRCTRPASPGTCSSGRSSWSPVIRSTGAAAAGLGALAVDQVLLREEALAGHAVPAVVVGPVDLVPVVQILQDLLHDRLVARLRWCG